MGLSGNEENNRVAPYGVDKGVNQPFDNPHIIPGDVRRYTKEAGEKESSRNILGSMKPRKMHRLPGS